MAQILETAIHYRDEIILSILILSVIVAILTLINYRRTTRVIKRYKKMMRGMDNKNLEYMLNNHIADVQRVHSRVDDLHHDLQLAADQLNHCVQRIGIVRYNPFEGVGSDQSFSLALMDSKGDGVVITSLYTRHTSSLYAKPLIGTKSQYPLSKEEEQAIQMSLENKDV